jgi:predicted transcriptional regulator of viral defense system
LGADSVEPVSENGWAIAMELFSPCYISGWTAAQHWDLTEQIFNTTVVVTAKKLRKTHYKVAGVEFKTRFTSEKNIFGTKKLWSGNRSIQIADLHRTIIDVLDDPRIGGGGRYMVDLVKAYWQKDDANPETLLQYAFKLNHGTVFKRLGFLSEKTGNLSTTLINSLHTKINKGIILLDPHGPKSGPIITKWGVRVNIPLEDVL